MDVARGLMQFDLREELQRINPKRKQLQPWNLEAHLCLLAFLRQTRFCDHLSSENMLGFHIDGLITAPKRPLTELTPHSKAPQNPLLPSGGVNLPMYDLRWRRHLLLRSIGALRLRRVL